MAAETAKYEYNSIHDNHNQIRHVLRSHKMGTSILCSLFGIGRHNSITPNMLCLTKLAKDERKWVRLENIWKKRRRWKAKAIIEPLNKWCLYPSILCYAVGLASCTLYICNVAANRQRTIWYGAPFVHRVLYFIFIYEHILFICWVDDADFGSFRYFAFGL